MSEVVAAPPAAMQKAYLVQLWHEVSKARLLMRYSMLRGDADVELLARAISTLCELWEQVSMYDEELYEKYKDLLLYPYTRLGEILDHIDEITRDIGTSLLRIGVLEIRGVGTV